MNTFRNVSHRPIIRPRSDSSYRSTAPQDVVQALRLAGWHTIASPSEHELARLRSGPGLIVVYHSGTILVQGTPSAGHVALAVVCEVLR